LGPPKNGGVPTLECGRTIAPSHLPHYPGSNGSNGAHHHTTPRTLQTREPRPVQCRMDGEVECGHGDAGVERTGERKGVPFEEGTKEKNDI